MPLRMKALYTAIAVIGGGFFVWLLVNMATGTDTASGFLTALGVSFVLIMLAIGASALMSRRDDTDVPTE